MTHTDFAGQRRDEKVIFVMNTHWLLMLPHAISGGIPLAIGLFMPFFPETSELLFGHVALSLIYLIWMVFWASYLVYHYSGWKGGQMIVTNQRVIDIDQQGVFHKKIAEMELSQIQTIRHEVRGAITTLYNVGNLYIYADNSAVVLVMEGVSNPAKAQERIQKLVHQVGAHDKMSAEELIRYIQTLKQEKTS